MFLIQWFDFSAGTNTLVYVWFTDFDSNKGGGLLNLLKGTLTFYEQGDHLILRGSEEKFKMPWLQSLRRSFICTLNENPSKNRWK